MRGFKYNWYFSRCLEQCLSHPSRVRGLKFARTGSEPSTLMSHPSRVRGLKSLREIILRLISMSHPSRVRGLKYLDWCDDSWYVFVAPLAGAWIEIFRLNDKISLYGESHPSRVRGLKYDNKMARLVV